MADSLSTKYHRRAVWGAEVASALFAAISMNRFGGAYFTYAMAVFLLFFMYDLYISWPVQRDFIPQIGSAKLAVIGVALFTGACLLPGLAMILIHCIKHLKSTVLILFSL